MDVGAGFDSNWANTDQLPRIDAILVFAIRPDPHELKSGIQRGLPDADRPQTSRTPNDYPERITHIYLRLFFEEWLYFILALSASLSKRCG
jgi:hypothetical protein